MTQTQTQTAHTPLKVETWSYDKADPPYKKLVVTDGTHLRAVIEADHNGDNPYLPSLEDATSLAHQFAAAPDLLAVAERALAIERSVTQGQEKELRAGFIELLESAIAKATNK